MPTALAARGRLLLGAALGAPAAAFAGAELLAVAGGHTGGAVPSGVHTYLPLVTRTGRTPLLACALLLALVGVCLLRGTTRVARPGLTMAAVASGQLGFLGAEVLLCGGLDAIPDAPSGLLVALLLQVAVAMAGLLFAAVLRSTVRLLRSAATPRLAGAVADVPASIPRSAHLAGRSVRIPHRRGPPAALLTRS